MPLDLIDKGLRPTRPTSVSLQMPNTSPGASDWRARIWRFPWLPPWVWLICWNKPQNSRETFTSVYQFTLKDIIEDTDEHSDKEVHGIKFKRVPSAGVSIPLRTGVHDAPEFTNLETLQISFSYSLRCSLHPLSPYQRLADGAEICNLLITWCLWPPHPEAI